MTHGLIRFKVVDNLEVVARDRWLLVGALLAVLARVGLCQVGLPADC